MTAGEMILKRVQNAQRETCPNRRTEIERHGGPFVVGTYYDGPSCTLVNIYSKSGRYLRTVQRCY